MTPTQRTGAGAPGSVDNPDLVVEVLGRTVVRTDVGGVVMTSRVVGTLSGAAIDGVGGGGALLRGEQDVATVASATATSRRRLNEQVEKESPRAAGREGLGPKVSAPGGGGQVAGARRGSSSAWEGWVR